MLKKGQKAARRSIEKQFLGARRSPPSGSPLGCAREGRHLRARDGERYRVLGYAFMVVEATNRWTGAAFEALGGVRVHFSPFQARASVRKSAEALEGVVTGPNGFLSDKDSGGKFYVIRLAQRRRRSSDFGAFRG
jgi:hypothetical protein